MIVRVSAKLAKKIKVAPSTVCPLDADPFVDWSAHVFTAQRAQYVIVANTASLYSVVMHGRGITDDAALLDRVMSELREFTAGDGLAFIFRQFVAPASGTAQFSKALNRSVSGSMNDQVGIAKMWLAEGELPPFDVSRKLNECPMSVLGYANPREVFKSLTAA